MKSKSKAELLPGKVAYILSHSPLHGQNRRGDLVIIRSPDETLEHGNVDVVDPCELNCNKNQIQLNTGALR